MPDDAQPPRRRGRITAWLRPPARTGEGPPADDPGSAAALLEQSVLFDHAWYARTVGRPLDRSSAVRHYLDVGSAAGLTPHPLFDPHTYRAAAGRRRVGRRDPLVAYLQRRDHAVPTHPLFEPAAYLAAVPAAAGHPGGPLAHWTDVGAAQGLPTTDWWQHREPRRWLEAQRDAWLALRARSDGDGPVEWASGPAPDTPPGADSSLLSVVVASVGDGLATLATIRSVAAAADIEVVVVAGAAGVAACAALAAAAESLPHVRALVRPGRLSRTEARARGIGHASGGTLLLLEDGAVAEPGWAPPLRAALGDDVTAAQLLHLAPSGTVVTAGFAFPGDDGLPHPLLHGHHADDAAGTGDATFRAVSTAALALRRADALVVRPDPDLEVTPDLQDVDLTRRLSEHGGGRLVVVPQARVVQHLPDVPRASRDRSLSREDRAAAAAGARATFRARWRGRLPPDDAALWAACGYTVHDHLPGSRDPSDDDHRRPVPLLSRTGRAALHVVEPVPRLRWAVENPAPAGPTGERWGDTHFARQLADALRDLGQDVVVDHREAFDRTSGRFDDVVLLLRGLTARPPAWGQVNLLWIISHPELVDAAEVAAHDRVFAASLPWAAARSHDWGVRVDPLLQATDPSLFHPDRAEPDTGPRLLFLGNSRKRERPVVRDAVTAGLDLTIVGSNWEGLVPSRLVHAHFMRNDEVGAVYRSAGLVLNDHWEEMRTEGFLSNRLFDAVAAGARVVSDDAAGLRAVFGDSVQVVRGPDDLRRLATLPDLDAVFGDDAARRAEAARIHAEHSFAARARTLLDAALEVRAAP